MALRNPSDEQWDPRKWEDRAPIQPGFPAGDSVAHGSVGTAGMITAVDADDLVIEETGELVFPGGKAPEGRISLLHFGTEKHIVDLADFGSLVVDIEVDLGATIVERLWGINGRKQWLAALAEAERKGEMMK